MSTISGMYIEKAKQASNLLAEIISACTPNGPLAVVGPYQEVLVNASVALRNIQAELREQDKKEKE